jgi:hypothetical protein
MDDAGDGDGVQGELLVGQIMSRQRRALKA